MAPNTIPLSSLVSDPVLRRFFEAGERDGGAALANVVPGTDPIIGGGAVALRRGEIEATIEWLVGLLDLVDADPDLEPSLAGVTFGGENYNIAALDCEDACEDEGAQCDDEGAEWDNGIVDLDGLLEQRAFMTGMSEFAGAV